MEQDDELARIKARLQVLQGECEGLARQAAGVFNSLNSRSIAMTNGFLQRVINERVNLGEKILRLAEFSTSPVYARLAEEDQFLLATQCKVMNVYAEILDRRIKRAQLGTTTEFEELLESAFWDFDARRRGDGEYKGHPQSERDAFKQVMSGLSAG
jgi:hypothetical protein